MNDLYKKAIELGIDPQDIVLTVRNTDKYAAMIDSKTEAKGLVKVEMYKQTGFNPTTHSYWRKKGKEGSLGVMVTVLEWVEGK